MTSLKETFQTRRQRLHGSVWRYAVSDVWDQMVPTPGITHIPTGWAIHAWCAGV